MLGEADQQDGFLRHHASAAGTGRDLGLAFDDARLVAIDRTLHFAHRRAAGDHDIVVLTRGDQRRLQPGVQHEHCGEDKHDQRHATRREGRGELAGP